MTLEQSIRDLDCGAMQIAKDDGVSGMSYSQIFFVCVGLTVLVFGLTGCAVARSGASGSIKECYLEGIGTNPIELRGNEKTRLMGELMRAIEDASAMKPNVKRAYKHRLFRFSEATLALCQLGPCLPVTWNFELSADRWVLINRPEGICVS